MPSPRRSTRRLVLVGIAMLPLGCGDDDEVSEAAEAPIAARGDADVDWRTQLEDGDPEAIRAALRRRHAEVRDRIGPHRLRYESHFELLAEPPPDALPPVDEPVVPDQTIADEVELVWLPADDDGPRLQLSQHNDQGRGRDVVASGGTLFTKLEHRPWMSAPVETDVFELWLDDAWRGPGDALDLAGAALRTQVEPRPGAGLAGGDALAIALAGDGATAPGRQGWRATATIETISGEVVLDAETGVWLAADIHVTYALPAPTGRRLRGRLDLEGTLAVLAPEQARIAVPEGATAIPERDRYDAERRRLLDGLAAP